MCRVRYLWLVFLAAILTGKVVFSYDLNRSDKLLIYCRQDEERLQKKYQNMSHAMNVQKEREKQIILNKIPYELISLNTSETLLKLVRSIEDIGYKVLALQPSAMSKMFNVNVLPVKIVIAGDLSRIDQILVYLSRANLNVGIRNFSLSIDEKSDVVMKMDAVLWGAFFVPLSSTVQSTDPSLSKYEQSNFTIPLQQMKLVGYLHDNTDFMALLMFPNGKTQSIRMGSLVGVEHGRVVDMSENKVVISVGQQKFIIYPKKSKN